MSRRYNTLAEYEAPGDVRTALSLTPAGQAITVVVASITFAVASQFVMLVAGGVVWLALKRTWDPEAMWRLLLLSGLPWILAVFQMLRIFWAFTVGVLETLTGQDINRSGMVGDVNLQPDNIRLIPWRGPHRMIDGVPAEDFEEFVEQLPIRGHSWRAWQGYEFKSGRPIDQETWSRMCDTLARLGIIQGRGKRRAGQLTIGDPQVIKELLGL